MKTDANGIAEISGFRGDYSLLGGDKAATFKLAKTVSESPVKVVMK